MMEREDSGGRTGTRMFTKAIKVEGFPVTPAEIDSSSVNTRVTGISIPKLKV